MSRLFASRALQLTEGRSRLLKPAFRLFSSEAPNKTVRTSAEAIGKQSGLGTLGVAPEQTGRLGIFNQIAPEQLEDALEGPVGRRTEKRTAASPAAAAAAPQTKERPRFAKKEAPKTVKARSRKPAPRTKGGEGAQAGSSGSSEEALIAFKDIFERAPAGGVDAFSNLIEEGADRDETAEFLDIADAGDITKYAIRDDEEETELNLSELPFWSDLELEGVFSNPVHTASFFKLLPNLPSRTMFDGTSTDHRSQLMVNAKAYNKIVRPAVDHLTKPVDMDAGRVQMKKAVEKFKELQAGEVKEWQEKIANVGKGKQVALGAVDDTAERKLALENEAEEDRIYEEKRMQLAERMMLQMLRSHNISGKQRGMAADFLVRSLHQSKQEGKKLAQQAPVDIAALEASLAAEETQPHH